MLILLLFLLIPIVIIWVVLRVLPEIKFITRYLHYILSCITAIIFYSLIVSVLAFAVGTSGSSGSKAMVVPIIGMLSVAGLVNVVLGIIYGFLIEKTQKRSEKILKPKAWFHFLIIFIFLFLTFVIGYPLSLISNKIYETKQDKKQHENITFEDDSYKIENLELRPDKKGLNINLNAVGKLAGEYVYEGSVVIDIDKYSGIQYLNNNSGNCFVELDPQRISTKNGNDINLDWSVKWADLFSCFEGNAFNKNKFIYVSGVDEKVKINSNFVYDNNKKKMIENKTYGLSSVISFKVTSDNVTIKNRGGRVINKIQFVK